MFSTFDLRLLLYVIRLAGWLKHCNLSLSAMRRYPSYRYKASQLCQQALLDSRRATMPRLLVVPGVTCITSWQPDRLAQRELFDEKTRRVMPDYYAIGVDQENSVIAWLHNHTAFGALHHLLAFAIHALESYCMLQLFCLGIAYYSENP